MDHFHDTHCGCNQDEIDHDNAMAMARVRHNPVAALRDISNGEPEPVLLQSVVNLSLTEPRIRRAGAATLFIRYLLHGYKRNYEPHPDPSISPEPHWAVPLMGLLNILAGISKEGSSHRDSAILAELQGSYSAVCAIIWHDLSRLLLPGPQADYRRRIVILYIGNMLITTKNKSQLYDDTTIALVMHCWMNMSTDRENRKNIVGLVISLFAPGHIDSDALSDCLDKAVRAVTVDTINLRIQQVLLDPKLTDDAIEDELHAIKPFVVASRPWAQAFVRSRTYDAVAQALSRHLKAGSNRFTPDILNIGSSLLYNFQSVSEDTMTTVTDMIQNTPWFEVAAQGLVIADQNQSDDWIGSFDRLTHAVDCHNPDCNFRATPTFLVACKVKLEPLYIHTREQLKRSGKTNSKALMQWEEFAATIGISESMLFEKWKRENQCCYPGCTMRGMKTAPGDVRQCAGCKSVYYHGKLCQKADWKRHKKQCKQAA